MFKCEKHPEVTEGIVCGGSCPHYNHGDCATDPGNIYFYMNLKTGEYVRRIYGEVPFDLTEKDWQDMFSHADGGCCGESQCPICLEYMERQPE